MHEMPVEMQSDAPGNSEYLVNKSLQSIDLVRRQLDRISYLRSAGLPWGPAVEMLRDLVVGLEDPQFFDGLPAQERKRVEELEKDASDKKALRRAQEIRDQYKHLGWNGVPMQAICMTHGRVAHAPQPTCRPRFKPRPDNLSDQLQIVMSLLGRKNLLWKTRTASPLPPMPSKPVGENHHG